MMTQAGGLVGGVEEKIENSRSYSNFATKARGGKRENGCLTAYPPIVFPCLNIKKPVEELGHYCTGLQARVVLRAP